MSDAVVMASIGCFLAGWYLGIALERMTRERKALARRMRGYRKRRTFNTHEAVLADER